VTWAALAADGVGVDPADKEQTPPQFTLISHNFWRTPLPHPNQQHNPFPHVNPPPRLEGQRHSEAPDRLGKGTVCQENTEKFRECARPCEHAHMSNRESTAFMLKYHDGKQWGLHATRAYGPEEWMGEYRGEMVDGTEGRRRRAVTLVTDPSYLLAVGPRFLDAETYGNAM
jgi:hypothetical protein